MYKIVNNKKLILDKIILFFLIIVILILFLLFLYYFTPNNYIFIEKNDLVKVDEYKMVVKQQEKVELDNNLNNYYIKLAEPKELNVVIKNMFKAQSIILSDKIIKLRYNSKLIINNNTNETIELKIDLYK